MMWKTNKDHESLLHMGVYIRTSFIIYYFTMFVLRWKHLDGWRWKLNEGTMQKTNLLSQAIPAWCRNWTRARDLWIGDLLDDLLFLLFVSSRLWTQISTRTWLHCSNKSRSMQRWRGVFAHRSCLSIIRQEAEWEPDWLLYRRKSHDILSRATNTTNQSRGWKEKKHEHCRHSSFHRHAGHHPKGTETNYLHWLFFWTQQFLLF